MIFKVLGALQHSVTQKLHFDKYLFSHIMSHPQGKFYTWERVKFKTFSYEFFNSFKAAKCQCEKYSKH